MLKGLSSYIPQLFLAFIPGMTASPHRQRSPQQVRESAGRREKRAAGEDKKYEYTSPLPSPAWGEGKKAAGDVTATNTNCKGTGSSITNVEDDRRRTTLVRR